MNTSLCHKECELGKTVRNGLLICTASVVCLIVMRIREKERERFDYYVVIGKCIGQCNK